MSWSLRVLEASKFKLYYVRVSRYVLPLRYITPGANPNVNKVQCLRYELVNSLLFTTPPHPNIMSAQTFSHIVFIAFSVSGHLNVHLASIEHLLSLSEEQSSPLHVHLLSFEPAAEHGPKLSALANTRHKFTFHSLGEPVLFTEAIPDGHLDRHGPARLLTRGGLQPYHFLGEALGLNPEQYIALYENVLDILGTIKPKIAVAVVDIMMPMGKDACVMANVHWGILCPNSGWDLAKHSQPLLRGFCKFPA